MSEDSLNDSSPEPAQSTEQSHALNRNRALYWGAGVLIILLGAAAYWNSLTIPPIEEDEQLFFATNALHRITTAIEADAPEETSVATLLSLAANWRLTPGSMAGLRAGSIAIHLATGVALFVLCKVLFLGPFSTPVSLVAALLFVLHPITTESVHTLAHRGGLVATLFIILSLVLYFRATRAEDRIELPSLIGALTAFALAWAFRSTAVAVPGLVLVADWVVRGPKGWRKRAPFLGAFWALLAAFVVSHWATSSPASADVTTGGWLEHCGALWTFLMPVLTGRGLSLIHPTPDYGGLSEVGALLAVGVTVALLATGVVMTVRRSLLGLACLWFVGLMLLSGMLPDGGPLMSEIRVYPALAGLALAVPWLASVLLPMESTRLVTSVGAVALVLACAMGTYFRNDLWNSPLDLWFQAASHAPASPEVHRQMGRLHLERAERLMMELNQIAAQRDATTVSLHQERIREAFAAAERHLRRSTDLDDTNPDVFEMLGMSLSRLNQPGEAREAFYNALRLDPIRPSTMRQLGATSQDHGFQTGDLEALARAIEYFEQAARFGRLGQEWQFRYGLALAELGEFEQAEAALAPLLTDDQPEDSPLRQQLAEIRAAREQMRNLRTQIASLQEEQPGSPTLYRAQAQLALQRRQYLHAFYYFDVLLDMRPTDANAWIFMGYVRARLDDTAGFLNERPQPPAMPGEHQAAWMQLAATCARGNLWDATETYLTSRQARSALADSPESVLADVALSLGQVARAQEYLRAAVEANPENPQPWLALVDLALAIGDMTAARGYLGEAERRGADASALQQRQARIAEMVEREAERPPRAIIR